MAREPRPYQRLAMNAIYRECKDPTINPIVALPVGVGKEATANFLIKEILFAKPKLKILCLTHVKELIQQNYTGLLQEWSSAPAAIYSAGIGRKDIGQITFAGIQSIAKKSQLLGKIDIVIIDECHLISTKAETLYVSLLNQLKEINPTLRVIGFTGTPFRLGEGYLHENHPIFNKIAINMCDFDGYNYFFDEGYLTKLTTKKTITQLDISKVSKSAGDYNQHELQMAIDKETITRAALTEAYAYGNEEHKQWIIFASGCEHSDHIRDMLINEFSISAVSVHSKMDDTERDEAIAGFKSGKYRVAVNNLVLTTGFNHPPVSLLIDLAPTTSPVRYIQKLGRVTRPVYAQGFDLSTLEGRMSAIENGGKPYALVLDFAGNIAYHGAINDVRIRVKGEGGGGEPPVKTCMAFACGCVSTIKTSQGTEVQLNKCDIHDIDYVCGTYHHPSVRFCDCCGAEFIAKPKIKSKASTLEVVAKEKTIDVKTIEEQVLSVQGIHYRKHTNKKTGNETLRVTYQCGMLNFDEYVSMTFGSKAYGMGASWWNKRISGFTPKCVDEALDYVQKLVTPFEIKVKRNGKYLNVAEHYFSDDIALEVLENNEKTI